MVHVYLVPSWFFGMDVIFELVFAVITLLLSIYSLKVYRLTGETQPKLFGEAFMFFSISYFIQSLLNFAIISKLGENICTIAKIQNITTLNLFGTYIHMLFFLTGLVTLTYMTLRVNNKKIYTLLLLISIFSLIFSSNQLYYFSALSSLLLIYILYHYTINYLDNKHFKTFSVLLAFFFLLIGHIQLILAVNHELFYVIGHFLELFAYILILINLLIILRK